VTVPAGQSSVSFAVQGNGVSAATTITLSANCNAAAASTALTVAPGDKVKITSATYSQSTHVLAVAATDSTSLATLNLSLGSNQLLGAMANQGDGTYTRQAVVQPAPSSISIVSNLGAKTSQGVTLIP
jgi:hypothetical protein